MCVQAIAALFSVFSCLFCLLLIVVALIASVKGTRYFDCPAESGIVVRPSAIVVAEDANVPPAPSADPDEL